MAAAAKSRILVAGMILVAALAVSCSASEVTPQETPGSPAVTVPEEISRLDPTEVDRRLGGLLEQEGGSAQAAPSVEPGPGSESPTLDEILDLLDETPVAGSTEEIVFSISPRTLSMLLEPVLRITVQPVHGTVDVVAANRIIYRPARGAVEGDSFEYELLDGDSLVFSQVVEVRP